MSSGGGLEERGGWRFISEEVVEITDVRIEERGFIYLFFYSWKLLLSHIESLWYSVYINSKSTSNVYM